MIIRCAKIAAIMDKIPDQVGYLVLTEDGAVLESGGELENDERVATIITDLITLSNKCVMSLLRFIIREIIALCFVIHNFFQPLFPGSILLLLPPTNYSRRSL